MANIATDQTVNASIGRFIARRRKAKSLSQEKLAEIAGVHRHTLGNIERGESVPTMTVFLKFCRALEIDSIPVDELFPAPKKK